MDRTTYEFQNGIRINSDELETAAKTIVDFAMKRTSEEWHTCEIMEYVLSLAMKSLQGRKIN